MSFVVLKSCYTAASKIEKNYTINMFLFFVSISPQPMCFLTAAQPTPFPSYIASQLWALSVRQERLIIIIASSVLITKYLEMLVEVIAIESTGRLLIITLLVIGLCPKIGNLMCKLLQLFRML